METRTVTEGATTLVVPAASRALEAGPGRRGAAPFFNAGMDGSRDVTVLLASSNRARSGALRLLDGLCGTGARGLRAAVEGGVAHVTLNDWSETAVALARRNAEANGVADRVEITRRDLGALLREASWEHVEIDPFGSPIPFVQDAVAAVTRDGILGFSATDTAALHGARPEAGRRRYLGEPPPRHAPGWHEAALRFFAGTVVRMAAQEDVAATPVLLHVWGHALRAFFRVRAGAGRADAALGRVGPATLCPACQGWGLGHTPCPCGAGKPSGPYWLGPLHDAALASDLKRTAEGMTLARPAAVRTLLATCAMEADLPPFYVDLHRAARARGVARLPPTERLRERLEQRGYAAVVPHGERHGIKSDAAPDVVLQLLEDLSSS